jgi:hypothetical protein
VHIHAGGTLVLDSGASAGGLAFMGGGGDLVIAGGVAALGALSGVVAGDTVDLAGLSWVSGASATFVSGHVLAVSAGGQTVDLTIDPGQGIGLLLPQVTSDRGGGTLLTFSAGGAHGGLLLASASPHGGASLLAPVTAGSLTLAHS